MENVKYTPAEGPEAVGSAKSDRKSASNTTREMLDVACKITLSGPIIMGGIFLGSFAFITWLLIGGAAILLGGGALLCLASAIHLFTQIAASGYAFFGLGLVALSGFGLFTFASVYWYKRILPTVFRLGKTLRIWITDKKGCNNE